MSPTWRQSKYYVKNTLCGVIVKFNQITVYEI